MKFNMIMLCYQKGPILGLLFALTVLVNACDNGVQKPLPKRTDVFPVPTAIQSAALPSACINNLTAWVSINSGEFLPLIIEDNLLSVPLQDLSLGGHVFEIEFRCLNQGNQIVLIKGIKSHQVTLSEDPVIFNDADYVALTDTDNDNVSNIEELELGFEPTIANNPEEPSLAVSAGVKQLRFSWEKTLFTTHYTLMTSSDSGMNFNNLVSDNITALKYTENIAVHRLDWPNTQYQLSACNLITCTASISLSTADKVLETIAYIKAFNTGTYDYFGRTVALSDDGNTLAVGAIHEKSAARGINDTLIGETDDSAGLAGAVYVFTRLNNVWQQQAYVKPLNTEPSGLFGTSIALSAGGNTLAVSAILAGGSPADSNDITLGQADDSTIRSGAAFVFTRSNNIWQQQVYIKPSNTQTGDNFGKALALSADGNTLAVGADLEDSFTSVINSPLISQMDNTATNAGAAYVFVRVDSTWQQQAYIKTNNMERADQFGWSVALSASGNTLAVGAPGEDSAVTGTNATFAEQSDNSATSSGAVYLFTRANATWIQQAYIKASNTESQDLFGSSLSLSADGNTLAVGAHQEASAALGVNDLLIGESDNDSIKAGAVYVYARVNFNWQQQAYVKASNTSTDSQFGFSVALSADGNSLAVGASTEYSAAVGVNSTLIGPTDKNARSAGAVYIFDRMNNDWQQKDYVKASNTEMADYYRWSLTLSGDGKTLAVGAPFEDSAADGINNIAIGQADFTAPNAGAVYLY